MKGILSLTAMLETPRADSRSRPLCCPHVLYHLYLGWCLGPVLPFPELPRCNALNLLSPQRGNSEGTTLGNPCTEVARKESRGEALGSTLFWDVGSPQTQSGTLPKLQAEAGTLPSADLMLPTSDQNVHIP